MGTRFVCATECTVHARFKEAIIKAGDRDTVVTGFPGHYVRVLKNKLTRQFEEMASRRALPEEMERLGAGRLRAAVVEGDVEFGSLMAGQVAAMVKDIKPAAAIIQEVMQEAAEVITQMAKQVAKA
jgi:enoyl-[acyl-carrier protein] reductase II